MSNRFIPLSAPHLKGNELKYLTECIETNWVSTAGGFVKKFEEKTAEYSGAGFAVATNSGTSALHIALKVLKVGQGDEVVVPTVTFIAPVNAVRYVGAEPVFMDCDDYLNMDSKKLAAFIHDECSFDGLRLSNRRTGRTVKAIIPVHIFGHPVDMGPIMELAEKYNLYVVEDASESLGSRYISGGHKDRMTATVGHIGCLSFNGNKIITTGGGGMLLTGNEEWADYARYLTNQAKDDEVRYIHNEIGYNYRMVNTAAAMGLAQLEQLDEFIETKRRNFALYKELLRGVKGVSLIEEPPYARSNYWLYSAVLDGSGLTRDALYEALQKEGIQTRPLWGLNHFQRPYQSCQAFGIEKAPYMHERVLNLPSSVGLRKEDIERVCRAISQLTESKLKEK